MKPKNTIYSRFAQQVELHPDAVAVCGDGGSLTFRELDTLADRILWKFQGAGHRYIGVEMEHGPEMIAAILSVLKSGAAYVPAEPSLPEDRKRYMYDKVGATLVITDDYCKDLTEPDERLCDSSETDRPAYVLYTSGTSGRPKGVVATNENVVNYVEAFKAEFNVGPGDRMLQCSVCSFDIFVEEVFTTLLNGASLAIPGPDIVKGGIGPLMDFVERHKVTEISAFPYLLSDMNNLPSIPESLRLLISGGDVLRASHIDKLKDRGVTIYNTYGPSETTVCASYCRCDNIDPLDDGTYPIGHPVKNVEIRILDDNLKEVEKGRSGEICILGRGVTAGYVGNPPEQKNFIKLGDGRRLYRSGDLGYILPDGNIAFLRRKDEQVMILGKRVEPEEVENVLNSSPDVERGVVCPYKDDSGLSYLVAYFVPKSRKFSLSSIRKWLASKLTDFMIPEFFVAMSEIPLTARGKVNKKELPVVLKQGIA